MIDLYERCDIVKDEKSLSLVSNKLMVLRVDPVNANDDDVLVSNFRGLSLLTHVLMTYDIYYSTKTIS